MMKILGVRCGHDAAAALILDGEIVADVAEERFTRIKNDASFPIHAIQYCLKAGNVASKELDVLAIPSVEMTPEFFSFFAIPKVILPEQYRKKPKKVEKKFFRLNKQAKQRVVEATAHNDGYAPARSPILPLYQKPLPLSPECTIVLVDHHLAHAASACYTSGVSNEKALVVTMDGRGDHVSVALWRFEQQRLECLKKYDGSSSLGWFYANATEAMEWRHGSDEWKVMGLAPYGVPQPGALRGYYPEFEQGELIRPHEYSEFGRWKDHGAMHYHGKDAHELSKIYQTLGSENFAAEVQRISEEQAFNLILPWLERENTHNILCAGGFFLNVKFNQKLWYSGKVARQWVYPNAGDAGIAVGAALYAYYATHPHEHPQKLEHLYRGPEYSNDEIQRILDDRGLTYRFVDDPSDAAARYLAQNYVIGWFQGRMEAGPRALGNRSILMSPLKAENKDLINRKIKYREYFRPFAPALPVEKMHDYLVNPREELFMTCSFDVVEQKQQAIPAVVHVDGTARPQMVKREVNPRYYDLIMKFGELTGEYVILNTSFNVKGEPIVRHPREALKCFFDTGMDVLIINNYVLEKPALCQRVSDREC